MIPVPSGSNGTGRLAHDPSVGEYTVPLMRRHDLRVGVAGLGFAAHTLHLPALRAIADVTIAGGCDPDERRRAEWSRTVSGPAFASFDELLVQTRPDLVVIASPPDTHLSLCASALASGAHVICEKPFVATVADAETVLRLARVAGRFVAVNHEFREMPIFARLRERIGDQDIGRLLFAQVWQVMDLTPWDEPVKWRAALADRALWEAGIHLVDLLLHLFGEKPLALYARTSNGSGPLPDAIHLVTLEFSGGPPRADQHRSAVKGRHPVRGGAMRV